MTNPNDTTRLICPLTATTIEAMRAEMTAAAAAGADTVECRLDYLTLLPNIDWLDQLFADAPLPIIATCRPTRQGGQFDGPESLRLQILSAAANHEAVVAVDIETDVPPENRPAAGSCDTILSIHDFAGIPADLDKLAATMDRSAATINKIAFTADADDALRAFDVIRNSAKPTLALAMGEAGIASRVLAKKFGAYGTFGSLEAGRESAPGQLSLADMKQLYRWDALDAETAVYAVIGCPISHSMSPAIHNAAFEATGRNAVYLPMRIEPGADAFNRFMDAVVARPWLDVRGLSVTIPHKENALNYVGPDNCDPLAVQIGAVNTITIAPDGSLRGDNTDYAGAIDALCCAMGIAREGLAGRSVAVLGAGGVARAIVAALAHYRAETTVYNRTVSRAETLVKEFNCRAAGIDALANLDAEIVINCTPLGMHPNTNASPLPPDKPLPSCVKVVFDTIYNPVETRLLLQAAQAGCVTASGLDMFVNQAVAQFEIWTGQNAPREVMRKVVIGRLNDV
ncbi:MAG: shikimate dehydrogenase [Phycisphaerae bacterium]|nr:shikimate dehydrogenase [Phycisphaerae bacterium]